MRPARHDLLPRVTDICADESEVLGLAVIRFIAAGATTGDAACWDAAHNCAESVLGYREGPALVAAMACLVRTIMRERRADFACLPATCCRVTPDERDLIGLVAQCRRDSAADLSVRASQFCGTADGTRLTHAARAAGEALDRAQRGLRPPGDWKSFGHPPVVH